MGEHSTVERQKRIVEILRLLHEGGNFEEAKRMFNESFEGIDVTEITAAERELIQSGLNPSEIQKLCNVHAAVFKGSITDIHRSNYEHEQPGHPVHTLKLENRVLRSLIDDEIRDTFKKLEQGDWSQKERLLRALEDLQQIDKHYTRKETLYFTYMEKYGISAPPKVMWGVDDAVRKQIKELITYVKSSKAAINPLDEMLDDCLTEIEEMIFKEEEIMIPMCLDVFSLKDWEQIEEDSKEIGFSFIPEPLKWKASKEAVEKEKENEPLRLANIERAKMSTDTIQDSLMQDTKAEEKHYDWENTENNADQVKFKTGILKVDQLVAIFDHLPVDITFVDETDRVRFYSEGTNGRIFPRTKSVIGRQVMNCHPPKSLNIVEEILADFKAGKRTEADFWLDIADRTIYIRYYALFDGDTYLGCLEVTQDITDIKQITGSKRLLDEA